MAAAWLPPGKQTFVDDLGNPLVGGFVHHYIPATSTRKDTWQDYDQAALNTNPIVLDERGQCMIWGAGAYRQVLQDADGNEIWDRLTTVGNQASVVMARGAISGLRVQNNTGNPTTQIDVAIGQARDSTNIADLYLTAPITKSITAVWAAGTGNGMRDSATAIAAGQFSHIFLIYNPTTAALDVLSSQSPTAPNLPNGYTLFRRIWCLPVLGGANRPPSGTGIPAFVQWGNQCLLTSPNNEFSGQTGSTAPALKVMLVPLGIKVEALCFAQCTLTPDALVLWRATDPDNGVPPALGATNQFAQIRLFTDVSYLANVFQMSTNTSGQLYIEVSNASAIWAVKTYGWIDHRGQDD